MKLAGFILFLLCFCTSAFAQDVSVSDDQFIKLLIESIGGAKGAGALVIAGIVVKLLMAAFNAPFTGKYLDKFTGKSKLLIVTLLSLAGGIIALMASGLSFGAAVVHSSILPAIMVFINQIYKQFIEKAFEAPKSK